jgi:hypothetical protein
MPNVIMPNDSMLIVIMMIVVMLDVMAPFKYLQVSLVSNSILIDHFIEELCGNLVTFIFRWEETNPSNIPEHLYMDIRKLLA